MPQPSQAAIKALSRVLHLPLWLVCRSGDIVDGIARKIVAREDVKALPPWEIAYNTRNPVANEKDQRYAYQNPS
jgi:hypothetical protein